MSFEKASGYLNELGYGDRVIVLNESSATVALAAAALGTSEGQIAKSLTFMVDDKPVMVICAGDKKIDNAKYKQQFNAKAKMLSFEEVSGLIGHEVGGVCPFGINDGVEVYLDISLKEYEIVYPACGSGNSAVKLTPDELEGVSKCIGWVDVCKSI